MNTTVDEAINDFVKTPERGYASTLEKFLHPAFRDIIVEPATDEAYHSQYMRRVRDCIARDADQSIDILAISFRGLFACITAALSSAGLCFSRVYSLIKERGRWHAPREANRETDHAA
jgi:hypothetical protein